MEAMDLPKKKMALLLLSLLIINGFLCLLLFFFTTKIDELEEMKRKKEEKINYYAMVLDSPTYHWVEEESFSLTLDEENRLIRDILSKWPLQLMSREEGKDGNYLSLRGTMSDIFMMMNEWEKEMPLLSFEPIEGRREGAQVIMTISIGHKKYSREEKGEE